MCTHLMRRCLSRLRLEMQGQSRRHRLSRGSGYCEFLEQRAVMTAPISAVGSTVLAATSDNSTATARDLGALAATPITESDFVGSADTQDYFRFTVVQSSSVSLNLSGLSADADLQLLGAQGQSIASSTRGGAVPQRT